MIDYPDFLAEYRRLLAAFGQSEPSTERIKARHELCRGLERAQVHTAIDSLLAEKAFPGREQWRRALQATRVNRPRYVAAVATAQVTYSNPAYARFRQDVLDMVRNHRVPPMIVAQTLENAQGAFPEIDSREIEALRASSDWESAHARILKLHPRDLA